jgi:hypothetical protein
MVLLHIFIPTTIVVIPMHTATNLWKIASSCKFVIRLELERHAFVPAGAINFTYS